MRTKLALPMLALLILAFILATSTITAATNPIRVSFIDVGQGGAVLI